jgi:hypothetical protein
MKKNLENPYLCVMRNEKQVKNIPKKTKTLFDTVYLCIF